MKIQRILARIPVTLIFVLFMWAVHILTRLSGRDPLETYGVSFLTMYESWRFITSGFTAHTLGGLVIYTLLILFFGGSAEYSLGSRKFIGHAAVFQLVSVVGGLILTSLLAAGDTYWGLELTADIILAPAAWLAPTLWAAADKMPALPRRRIKVILVAATISMVLYAGAITDLGRAVALTVAILMTAKGGQSLQDFLPTLSVDGLRWLVAAVTVTVAAGPLLAASTPALNAPLSVVRFLTWPGDDFTTRIYGFPTFLYNLMPFVLVMVVAWGLARGQRVAWWIMQVFMASSVLLLLAEGASIDFGVGILLTIAPWIGVMILLALTYRYFGARTSVAALRTCAWVSGVALVLAIALWLLILQSIPELLSTQPSIIEALLSSWERFLPPVFDSVLGSLVGGVSTWSITLLHLPGLILWVVVSVMLLRAFRATPEPSDEERTSQRMREILIDGTGDHLSWMTHWPHNRAWFGEGGYVAYRLHRAVAVSVGGPVLSKGGDRDLLAAEFEAYATEQGWTVAWYCVTADFAAQRSYRTQVAEEAIVPVDRIPFRGKKFQDVRTARNRAAKEGIEALWTSWAECGPVLQEEIRTLSEEWVADKTLPELGFTLGGMNELYDERVHLMLARDEEGTVHGVTSWLPVYEEGHEVGWVLDFMRRNPQGFRPVVEFLIAETLIQAQAEGLGWISLSGAPLSRSVPSEDKNVLDQMLDTMSHVLEPLYGFKSLAAFKSKFQPEEVPWYMTYNDPAELPAIGLAVSHAYAPHMSVVDFSRIARALIGSSRSEK